MPDRGKGAFEAGPGGAGGEHAVAPRDHRVRALSSRALVEGVPDDRRQRARQALDGRLVVGEAHELVQAALGHPRQPPGDRRGVDVRAHEAPLLTVGDVRGELALGELDELARSASAGSAHQARAASMTSIMTSAVSA